MYKNKLFPFISQTNYEYSFSVRVQHILMSVTAMAAKGLTGHGLHLTITEVSGGYAY